MNVGKRWTVKRGGDRVVAMLYLPRKSVRPKGTAKISVLAVGSSIFCFCFFGVEMEKPPSGVDREISDKAR